MTKIIKVTICGGCPCNKRVNGPSYDRFCTALYPKNYFFKTTGKSKIKVPSFSITDPSKILPNCPLEDYPEIDENQDLADRAFMEYCEDEK